MSHLLLRTHNHRRSGLLPAAAVLIACFPIASPANPGFDGSGSVVKLHTTVQRADPALPWQQGRPRSGSGSGFIIKGKKILTNAHVVSDARFIEVQKDGQAKRFPARVVHIAHDCDLAAIVVDDPEFFEGTTPLAFADAIPSLTDEVLVVGYPMGGIRLSVTRGIVSRIDYSTYTHSGLDSHLVLQVDAAINPGNSGGPIFFNERVVGVAFQGISWGENLGYAIPLPVIRRFLKDIADGTYNGYPELGVAFLPLRNPALRKAYNLPEEKSGVLTIHTDPFGSAYGLVMPGDILTSIDGLPLANDGTIRLDDNNVNFAEMLERKQRGDAIALGLWRTNHAATVNVPLLDLDDPFMYRNRYDFSPRYVVEAGLVFEPMGRGHIMQSGKSQNGPTILYLAHFAKEEGIHKDRDEFILLTRRLPHAVNTYAERFMHGVVETVNGTPMKKLDDLVAAFDNPSNGFHVVRFFGSEDYLVIDAEQASESEAEIRRRYSLRRTHRLKEDR